MASVPPPVAATAGFWNEYGIVNIFATYVDGLLAIAAAAIFVWLISLYRKDVSIVDSLWSLMFLIAGSVYAVNAEALGMRGVIVLVLVAIWALRLSLYITVRNHGKGEDYRYREMREKNGAKFTYTSLYRVFGLQGLLAWIISVPLLIAIAGQPSGQSPPGILDLLAVTLWLTGFVFEAGGDYQLTSFKADPKNEGKVMDRGLWRYTRHPNYFGDACIWWAFYLFALSAGGWWTIYAPLLMTFFLLKVSGVAMLERTIGTRRPGYDGYVRRTNAFIPGPPRAIADAGEEA